MASADFSEAGHDFDATLAIFDEPTIGLTHSQSPEVATKLKRTACVLCRRRKLRCDTGRPKCGTCDRLGHQCEYNETRKKSGPKRGYVKALEARLSQVETQLKSNGQADSNLSAEQTSNTVLTNEGGTDGHRFAPSPHELVPDTGSWQDVEADTSAPSMEASWDMISLGLEEPLPTPEVQTELYDIYFRKIHPTAPMLHKARFYASLNYAPHIRPSVSLRYAMWTLATGASDAYADLQQHFYRRARKYMELDEMKAYGQAVLSLYACQTSVLLSIFEFKNMHFPRAWLSTGRAVRLSQLLGLHRLDGTGLEVKRCIAPPVDWTEKEERKRTFWMAFWADRCASCGTGWPMSIDERDIMTTLPASEHAFQNSQPETTPSLDNALSGQLQDVAAFAGAILLTALFGRNLLHLHRPTADEREQDLNGAFWERHRSIDATILNISLNMPEALRIPQGLPDPNVMFMNMCIHTSVICLHQAAIFRVDRSRLPASIGEESKIRCVTAAAEIANIMRSISHCDLGTLNPFSAFCLFVASRVFVQYLKSRRNDRQILGGLHFLLSSMHTLKRKTPLAESFLAQLDVDMQGAGIPSGSISIKQSASGDFLHQSGQGNVDVFVNGELGGTLAAGTSDARLHERHGQHLDTEMTLEDSSSRQATSNVGLSPSSSDSAGGQTQNQSRDPSSFTNHSSRQSDYDDNQPAGFVSFKDYSASVEQTPGAGVMFSLNGQSSMTQHSLDELTKQFMMPPTPGDESDAWSSSISIGLTPGPIGEDWTHVLDGLGTWDHQASNWSNLK